MKPKPPPSIPATTNKPTTSNKVNTSNNTSNKPIIRPHRHIKIHVKNQNGETSKPRKDSMRDDISLLMRSLDTSLSNVQQIIALIKKATPEIIDLITNECSIIFECKICKNLFRSIANFMTHKRGFCIGKFEQLFQDHDHADHMWYSKCQKNNNKVLSSRSTTRKDIIALVETMKAMTTEHNTSEQVIMKDLPATNEALFNLRYETQDPSKEKEKTVTVTAVETTEENGELESIDSSHCSFCQKEFPSQKALSVHMKKHHGDMKMCFVCPCCKKYFANTWSVYRHMYKVHRKTSEQVRKLRTQIQKKQITEEEFLRSKRGNLASPQDEKTQDKAYMEDLRGHVTLQRCSQCGKQFERKVALIAHLSRCHKKTPAPPDLVRSLKRKALTPLKAVTQDKRPKYNNNDKMTEEMLAKLKTARVVLTKAVLPHIFDKSSEKSEGEVSPKTDEEVKSLVKRYQQELLFDENTFEDLLNKIHSEVPVEDMTYGSDGEEIDLNDKEIVSQARYSITRTLESESLNNVKKLHDRDSISEDRESMSQDRDSMSHDRDSMSHDRDSISQDDESQSQILNSDDESIKDDEIENDQRIENEESSSEIALGEDGSISGEYLSGEEIDEEEEEIEDEEIEEEEEVMEEMDCESDIDSDVDKMNEEGELSKDVERMNEEHEIDKVVEEMVEETEISKDFEEMDERHEIGKVVEEMVEETETSKGVNETEISKDVEETEISKDVEEMFEETEISKEVRVTEIDEADEDSEINRDIVEEAELQERYEEHERNEVLGEEMEEVDEENIETQEVSPDNCDILLDDGNELSDYGEISNMTGIRYNNDVANIKSNAINFNSDNKQTINSQEIHEENKIVIDQRCNGEETSDSKYSEKHIEELTNNQEHKNRSKSVDDFDDETESHGFMGFSDIEKDSDVEDNSNSLTDDEVSGKNTESKSLVINFESVSEEDRSNASSETDKDSAYQCTPFMKHHTLFTENSKEKSSQAIDNEDLLSSKYDLDDSNYGVAKEIILFNDSEEVCISNLSGSDVLENCHTTGKVSPATSDNENTSVMNKSPFTLNGDIPSPRAHSPLSIDNDEDEVSDWVNKKIKSFVCGQKKKCLLCFKTFHTVHFARRHVALHFNVNKFRCLVNSCNFQSYFRIDMNNHLLKIHKTKESENFIGRLYPKKEDFEISLYNPNPKTRYASAGLKYSKATTSDEMQEFTLSDKDERYDNSIIVDDESLSGLAISEELEIPAMEESSEEVLK